MHIWAPRANSIQIVVGDGTEYPLINQHPDHGWFSGSVPLTHGCDYWVKVDGTEVPDPLARWLPAGPHGAARYWDPAHTRWTDSAWRGRSIRDDGCIYELHVGTFTPTGTLTSAIDRLDWLTELGVTHVELMPLATFDGAHGWGYDGVALNAVHESYGGPDALCSFVDACHDRGLAVILDVVHNHLGPAGNYWETFGPFITDAHSTPWGGAVNLDAAGSDDVRKILIDSTLGWIRDFHLDGLRLDAVHELVDDRAITYLEELAAAVGRESAQLGRVIEVTAESDRNDIATITAPDEGGIGLTAQWDDDVHHALHWLLTGEDVGYYADFASTEAVEYTLQRGFLHDGTWSSFRGRTHGRPIDFTRIDPWRFIVSVQTHDQVGNRAAGDRLSHLVGFDTQAAAAAILLTLPYTPLLFMGQEWGAQTPWQFFTDFPDPRLAKLVTEGRRSEFSAHGWQADDVPDPQAEQTFRRSVLDWSQAREGAGAQLANWYRTLLRLRRDNPAIASTTAEAGSDTAGNVVVNIAADSAGKPTTIVINRGDWITCANLTDQQREIELDGPVRFVEAAWPDATFVRCNDNGTRTSVTLHSGASCVMRRC